MMHIDPFLKAEHLSFSAVVVWDEARKWENFLYGKRVGTVWGDAVMWVCRYVGGAASPDLLALRLVTFS